MYKDSITDDYFEIRHGHGNDIRRMGNSIVFIQK